MCLRGSCVRTLKNHTWYTKLLPAGHGNPNFWSVQIWMIWIITKYHGVDGASLEPLALRIFFFIIIIIIITHYVLLSSHHHH